MLDPVTFLAQKGIDVRSLALTGERLIETISRLNLLDHTIMTTYKVNQFYDWLMENQIIVDFYLNAVVYQRYEIIVFTDNIEKFNEILMMFKLSVI